MTDALQTAAEYRCPGEAYTISRAVHLGRLARFYPACRVCEHRHETGVLSPRQVKRLRETEHRGQESPRFQSEEVGGVALGKLPPGTVREVAAALGLCLRRGLLGGPPPPAAGTGAEPRELAVVVAGDGRPAIAELVAAACEGLRWTGCHVVDLGAASTACLMFASDHLHAAGGLLVGAGRGGPHRVAMKLFGPGAAPLSPRGLAAVRRQREQGIDRPTRRFGGLRRFQAEEPYRDLLRPHYHALRPLRFVLDGACRPVREYLGRLAVGLACTPLISEIGAAGVLERVLTEEAHFGLHVDDDGERCRAVDERGCEVDAGRLLMLIARRLFSAEGPSGGTVVVPREAGPLQPHRLASLGAEVVRSDPSRAAMAEALRRHGAACGGSPDGRLWYGGAGVPLPDALHTLTHLLALLSRSDRPFSVVLDREAPWG